MDALAELIVTGGVQDFSVQQVADQAGVSHRTVYRHYPSRQALLEALAEWLSEQFATKLGASEDVMYEDLTSSVAKSFATMDEFDRHMRAYVSLMMSGGSRIVRREDRTSRLREAIEAGPASQLEAREARAVSALVRSLVSSTSWYQLTQQLGLDGATAGATAAWALEVLYAELERGGGPSLPDGEDR